MMTALPLPLGLPLLVLFEMELRLRKSCWGALGGMRGLKRDYGLEGAVPPPLAYCWFL